jgi:hypothetical protein
MFRMKILLNSIARRRSTKTLYSLLSIDSRLPKLDVAGSNPVSRYFASAAAETAAQRFLVASMIRCRAAALSFRLGFLATGFALSVATPECFLAAAQRFRCAAAIRRLAAALIFRRLRAGSGGTHFEDKAKVRFDGITETD